MGGGHDHHHHEMKVPDWRQYKVESCPELMQVQRALASQGLKDPWLRNEAWRYQRKPGYLEPSTTWRLSVFRGFKYGICLTAATVALEEVYKFFKPPVDHHHGHH